MRKFVALALAASILSPMAASAAVSRGELARDRADVREESREYRQAVRRGNPAQIREERGEYRDSVRELREDRHELYQDRRDDRRYGADRRHDHWNAPFRYTAFRPGYRADGGVYAPRFAIGNPRAYGLPMAHGANRWVRHYDDAVLINLRTGMVQRVVRGVFW